LSGNFLSRRADTKSFIQTWWKRLVYMSDILLRFRWAKPHTSVWRATASRVVSLCCSNAEGVKASTAFV
jgi:hypothetical protein